MTRASGRKAHSHGADFEKYLEDVVFKAALDIGYFKRIDKLNPAYVAVRNRAGAPFVAPFPPQVMEHERWEPKQK